MLIGCLNKNCRLFSLSLVISILWGWRDLKFTLKKKGRSKKRRGKNYTQLGLVLNFILLFNSMLFLVNSFNSIIRSTSEGRSDERGGSTERKAKANMFHVLY